MTRSGPLPAELETMLAWVACLADAQPIEDYVAVLEQARLIVTQSEAHNRALNDMVTAAQGRLLGLEIMIKLGKLNLPAGIDFEEAKAIARATARAVREQKLGYSLIGGAKA